MYDPQLLSVPNPFPHEAGLVRLIEPSDAPLNAIRKQLLDGAYDKPYIVDDGKLRYLRLGAEYVQSAMRIDEPDALHLPYARDMMGFLLFVPDPRRILLLGLGGGSLAKFCYRALPNAAITAVEIDPLVISLRRHFAIPDDNCRFRVIQADAKEYVALNPQPMDVLLVDAFDSRGVAHSLIDDDFLRQVHAALGPSGIAILNLAGATYRHAQLIEKVQRTFNRRTLLVAVKAPRTFVLFAFKDPAFEPDWRGLTDSATELQRIYGLDFPRLVDKMRRASRGRFLKQLATGIGNLFSMR